MPDPDSKAEEQHPLDLSADYALIKDRFVRGLAWVLTHQNRDGSWGTRGALATAKKEKITYTCQCIQLLLEAGFARDDSRIVASTRWLADYVHKDDPHRFSRTEALLIAGDYGTPVHNGDLADFELAVRRDLTATDATYKIDLFWHILPTLIAIRTNNANLPSHFETQLPYAEVAAKLSEQFEHVYRPADCITVANKANHTGLTALFLHSVDPNRYAERVRGMTNWIIESHSRSIPGCVHWDNSRGITSYVLIDLLRLGGSAKLAPLLPSIIAFLMPDPHGVVRGDRRAAFESSLHRESLYATILCLRAIATCLSHLGESSNRVLSEARIAAIDRYRRRSILERAHGYVRRHRTHIPWFVTALLCLVGAIVQYTTQRSDWGLSFLFTGIGGALGLLSTLIDTQDH